MRGSNPDTRQAKTKRTPRRVVSSLHYADEPLVSDPAVLKLSLGRGSDFGTPLTTGGP